ncbi:MULTISPECIES: gamma-glutamylcyclotransferase [Bacillus]|uniref:Gamma-glutamylcyclotransferase n=1 Tax=Bacillus zhangzhouensis TaxID=1178540 RepID=A0A081L6T0_9BACI|nr:MULTISPECIES: gamma-glutamylcyclotransferase [Bacillus]KEP24956.1 gamma-glutamylcyclotransferase [Bacillus zhangzhouensis]MDR0124394.1 gamma-glutamylcyclotransferase [Bacillus zhangzhouensis]PRO41369.1 gamma-glutamylcyclotransferase [Bacillus sp. LLTC93]
MTMKTLFVYGTLLKHEEHHEAYMKESSPLAKSAWINGRLYDTGAGYPACILAGKSTVYGELYEVTAETLNKLDALEEGYDKQEMDVMTDQGPKAAVAYTLSEQKASGLKEIESGSWKEYRLWQRKPLSFYYFAYGSCMDDARFKLAKVDHYFKRIVGGGALDRFTTRFTLVRPDGSRADMVEDGGETEGVLYEVPFDAIRYLYKREGVYEGTYRPAFVDVKMGDQVYEDCLTFLVLQKSEEIAPPGHYRSEIEKGADLYLSEAFRKKIRSHMDSLIKP